MSKEIVLATGGKAEAPIIIASAADRVTRFAARELARYLKRITGAAFRVREVTSGGTTPLPSPALLVGEGPWTADAPGTAKPEQGLLDSFALVTAGERVYLWGNRPRSTLYAVYAFLETLGCRFVEPGYEEVPPCETLTVAPLQRQETAGFALRNIFRNVVHVQRDTPFTFLNPDLHLPQIDWMAKRRLNHYEFYVDFYRYDLWEKHKAGILDALLERGFDLEVTHHSLHYFCPPDENHDWGEYGPETYLRNHPDWYLPAYEGGARGRWQTRVELPEVQRVVFSRYLDYLRRNPELKIVGLWPDDVPMNKPYKGLSHTDGYLKFWNKLSRLLAREFPDRLLATIAYFELIAPPQKVVPAPNQHLWFCPIARNYMYPLTDRRNREFRQYLQAWIEKMPPGRVVNFEYYGWCVPMVPHRENMRRDLPVYREMGSGGMYAWAGFTHNILGQEYRWAIDLYVLSELLWNPEADVTAAEQVWAKQVYGSAGEAVLEFYDLLKRVFLQERRQRLSPNYQWVNLDLLHLAQERLARAREQATSAEAVRRIDLLEKWTAYGCTNEVWRKGPPRKYADL